MWKKCDLCKELKYFSQDVLDCDMCELKMKMEIKQEMKRTGKDNK